MKQHWAILGFAACVAAVLGGLGWVTSHTLRLERMEVVARADARLQESIRLVLWRMDSTLTPIIAREAARPYFEYQPFYAADKAFANTNKGREDREVLVPSPLLQAQEPFVRVYYQHDSGELTSPQVPTGPQRDLAEGAYVTGYSVAAAQKRLDELGLMLGPGLDGTYAGVQSGRAPGGSLWDRMQRSGGPVAGRAGLDFQSEEPPAPQATTGLASGQNQQTLMSNEYQARQAVTDRARNYSNVTQQRAGPPVPETVVALATSPPAAAPQLKTVAPAAVPASPAPALLEAAADVKLAEATKDAADTKPRGESKKDASEKSEADRDAPPPLAGEVQPQPADPGEAIGQSVTQGQFIAHWIAGPAGAEPELIFTREVVVGERTLRQGFWLDWPALRTTLLDSAKDLLPQSSLRPVTDPARTAQDQATLGRTLAAIPVELIVPALAPPAMPSWTPVRTVIGVTWLAVLLAVVATGLVLRTSLELAERRGRFVSAVTHELRTPLTTFCLYSQMLADGMVKDEEAQKGYFGTLKTESQRLARIVESVLDYARLSGRRTTKTPTTTTVCDLMVPMRRPLAARCEQSGMSLEVEGDVHDSRPLTTDPAIVERIVYNLVDNACKYAGESEDKRIHLEIAAGERDLMLVVRDHGPGIDAGESARLFRPFVRGARHGHGSIPGLGLGLAIARGLAKELGGELESVGDATGAAFRLRLPRVMA